MEEYTSIDILVSVNAEDIHKDPDNLLNHVDFSDNQPSDKYDDPRDKTTFDSIADSNQMVTWNIGDVSRMGHLALITNIEFKDVPEGFFQKAPYDPGGGSWVAVMGDNKTNNNLAAKYTITFDSGYRGDPLYVIDPKLQIRKKENTTS
ncbi:hypothetical protein [Psychroserpens jangbogonensis]|uniref:hypothetical protein n=1 Tax=Psychroserpens jangbogonensis TaxID=1484460 RepID=UPI00126A0D37|nr:hypothetical protein [Psychroserpens jangbogonensis]